MGKVSTIKGNLFNAPKGSIIIHACNTKGVWGSGIAKEFHKRFPSAYNIYRAKCITEGSSLRGKCLLIPAGAHIVGCLFTSRDYAAHVDPPHLILDATRLAIADLIRQNDKKIPMHMCKINSNLFKVPWADTKKILKEFDEEFTVYDY
jgi:ADP-ribose 1''-phosphate phosphatase